MLIMPIHFTLLGALAISAASCGSAAGAARGMIDGTPQIVPSLTTFATPPIPSSGKAGVERNWGIAFSGGGIRSATFSIGVMKALYDAGYMDSVGIISSVSGGGYASYWLFRRQLDPANAGLRFGEPVFSNARFDQSICELGATGSFQTPGDVVGSILNSDSFDKYRWSIRRSFGFDESQASREPGLSDAAIATSTGAVPLFILNATIDAPSRGKFPNVLEISPEFFGSPSIGYHSWVRGDTLPAWSEAVAISGAAVAPLKRFVRNYSTPAQNDSVRVWDGGESENLGVLSLIRRHMKTIVLVDGEHDPDYAFAGYFILKNLLPAEGFSISVPAIDAFISSRPNPHMRFDVDGVLQGIVVSAGKDGAKPDTSRLFYVKLARPKAVEVLIDSSSAMYTDGQRYQNRIDSLVKAADKTSRSMNKCGALTDHVDGFRRETAVYNVAKYARLVDMLVSKELSGKGPNFLRYDFPQTTTAIQSFDTDQLRAFIGLGYLEAVDIGRLAARTSNRAN